MAISKDDAKHIAHLAKLGITDEEAKEYAGQLEDVLEYAEVLESVDTDKVKPTNQVTGLTNVFREDKVVSASAEERERLLANAPELEDGMFAVPHAIKKYK